MSQVATSDMEAGLKQYVIMAHTMQGIVDTYGEEKTIRDGWTRLEARTTGNQGIKTTQVV
jgi:hypothetical protein